MPACELVIFDCDGTLMDSEMLAAQCEAEALAELGLKITAAEYNMRFAGMASKAAFRIIEAEIGRSLPDDHAEKVDRAIDDALRRNVKPVEGAGAVLDMFDQPRCVCSNSGAERLEIELRRGELWDRFRPYVYSARDLPGIATKPAPDVFLHAAREFGIDPRACVVVEDSVTGVTGAIAAGMRVVGFTGGSHSHNGHADRLTEAGAETVIARLTDLPEVLEAFAAWDGIPA